MMRNNSKALKKAIKEVVPWGAMSGVQLFVQYLEWVRDYYKNGENVHAVEKFEWDSDAIQKTRLEMVEEILNEYNEWQTCEDKYFRVIHHPETYKDHKNEDGTWTVDDIGSHIEYSLGDYETTRRAFNDEYQFHKNKFFELLKNYIEELSD